MMVYLFYTILCLVELKSARVFGSAQCYLLLHHVNESCQIHMFHYFLWTVTKIKSCIYKFTLINFTKSKPYPYQTKSNVFRSNFFRRTGDVKTHLQEDGPFCDSKIQVNYCSKLEGSIFAFFEFGFYWVSVWIRYFSVWIRAEIFEQSTYTHKMAI